MKTGNLKSHLALLKNEHLQVLSYLKSRYPLFHNSNFFFRDFHYGLRNYLASKNISVSYPEAEAMAKSLAEDYEEKEIFIRVNSTGWRINFPEFVTAKAGDPL